MFATLDALEQIGGAVTRQRGIGRHRGKRVRQHVPEDRDHRRPPGPLLDLVERQRDRHVTPTVMTLQDTGS